MPQDHVDPKLFKGIIIGLILVAPFWYLVYLFFAR